jgi:uncharacterized membrane protein (DUF373 family)
MMYIISILIFSNCLGLFFMYMTRDCRNIQSRTEREYKMLVENQIDSKK